MPFGSPWGRRLARRLLLGLPGVGVVLLALAQPDAAFPATGPLPPGKDVDLVTGRCIICHGLELVAQQRQGRGGWTEIVDRMITWGAPITPDERQMIIEYLIRYLGQSQTP
ncbi:MAG: hypothetical protein L0214_08810 [candidate division NC10 bacterium]|nr:hypothetical protein [candidate division NC10 bacterium]